MAQEKKTDSKRNEQVIAIGILIGRDGSILMSKRPMGKEAGGFWEFPGGKVCPNESTENALARELKEEIGVEVVTFVPWLSRTVVSADSLRILKFFKVYVWKGEPVGEEGQEISWQSPRDIKVSPILPANEPILKFLKLPVIYSITNAMAFGEKKFLEILDRTISCGLRFVQIRDKHLSANSREMFVRRVVDKMHKVGGVVLVNGDCRLARETRAQGVHLSSEMLMRATKRPDFEWSAASCHNEGELQKAIDLNLDFVVYGPVLATPTHPLQRPIGWELLEKKIFDYPIPVYAIGGLSLGMLRKAQRAGATGIAMLRGSWLDNVRLDVL